ncbi:MAG: anthranilate phosphoribosyltransferase 2 [Ramlibacter sp.]|nr:anthranilate phosphoribosyltransferase 2 [Ramlibacter sp.]
MSINQYIKEIGRGQRGARPLDRAQATDLMGQVLDGTVTDLEVGAFCLAMRIKGETPDEMAGFLDAAQARMHRFPASSRPLVVLPSYNGARRLPVLTPLLALLVAQRGLPVLIHGSASEDARVTVPQVLAALDRAPLAAVRQIACGEVAFAPLELISPPLKRLLDARRVIGLRNSGHSMVKLMNPCDGAAVIVSSYTHREYAESMSAVFRLRESTALLLRGTEGEVVADARRLPQMDGFIRGRHVTLEEGRKGTLTELPDAPREVDATSTAEYINDVLHERRPVPASMAQQLEHILRLAEAA